MADHPDNTVVTSLAASISSVVLTVAGFVAAHYRRRKTERAALIKVVQDAAHDMIGDLRSEVGRLQDKYGDLEAQYDLCEAGHGECRAELAHYREEIERLMGQPIAAYTPGERNPVP